MSLEWAAATLYPSLTWLASRLTSYSWLASRLASIHEGKMLLTDVCNRLNDTSTRKSLDSRARSSRRGDRLRDVPEREPRCHPENGAGPPFSNPTPGGAALDGASPASAEPPAPLPSFIEEETSPALGGRFLFAALSAARRLVIRPLTLPVAPCVVTQRKR